MHYINIYRMFKIVARSVWSQPPRLGSATGLPPDPPPPPTGGVQRLQAWPAGPVAADQGLQVVGLAPHLHQPPCSAAAELLSLL